jgi:hypothetical protein
LSGPIRFVLPSCLFHVFLVVIFGARSIWYGSGAGFSPVRCDVMEGVGCHTAPGTAPRYGAARDGVGAPPLVRLGLALDLARDSLGVRVAVCGDWLARFVVLPCLFVFVLVFVAPVGAI